MADTAFSFTNSKGVVYHLHSKVVTLRGDKQQRIFFFAKDVRPEFAVAELPEGYIVFENVRNGFPTLKKKPQE